MTRHLAHSPWLGACILAALTVALAWPQTALAQRDDDDDWARTDTLEFEMQTDDYTEGDGILFEYHDSDRWMRVPLGDNLLTDPGAWGTTGYDDQRTTLVADYNRVDRVRLGIGFQSQVPGMLYPRFGARIAYAFGRKRGLYGVQLEQPLFPPGRIALGVSAVRKTDHNELQQVEDYENSLALLFARQDYRDYFEREGFGAYLSWRVPDFSTISVHLRKDEYRSLPLHGGTRSFFNRQRDLRDNPAIDEGEAHTVAFRLEGMARRTRRTRAGFYHWIDLERTDHGLGGDFEYTRLLADLRTVVRLSPATSMTMRLVGGHTRDGVLPMQKEFALGGVDGLRGRNFATFRGNQMAMAQAEYTAGLWGVHSGLFEGGLHAIVFVDAGNAWSDDGKWDIRRQRFKVDGGLGLSTSEDNLRVYVAKNLQDSDSDVVVSVRLQRPF